jgi:transcriptional regulator with XRE-family HTH domain
MTFGEKLIRLRKIKSITQDELAAIIGVSRQAVYKWESGKSYPEVTKLLEIKNVFNISIDDLLDENFEIELPKKKRKKRLSEDKKREIELEIEKEFAFSAPSSEEKLKAPEISEENNEATYQEKDDSEAQKASDNESSSVKEKKTGLFGRLFGRK